MEQLALNKRQNSLNRELFEAQEVCDKFNKEKARQTLR